MQNPFRPFLLLAIPFVLGAASVPPAAEKAGEAPARPGTVLTLLGTAGGPILQRHRSQPASLVTVNGRHFLVDSGDGTLRRLTDAGVRPNEIERIFLTHLHFDHTAGLASVLAFAWLSPNAKPIGILGPPGTAEVVADALAANRTSKTLFEAIVTQPVAWDGMAAVQSVDVETPTIVYRDEEVTVTAVANSHFDHVAAPKDSYGISKPYSYRFQTKDRSIVFSGDTGPSEALRKLAENADILVAEVIDLEHAMSLAHAEGRSSADLERIYAHHSKQHLSAEEVGKLAAAANVKMVVLNHLAFAEDREGAAAPFLLGVRKHFKGPVAAGRDLDQF